MTVNTRRNFLKFAATGAMVGCSTSLLGTIGAVEYQDPDHSTKFLQACQSGDLATVKSMLEQDKTLVTIKDQSGVSGFALSMLAGNPEVGKHLVAAGYETDLHESALAQDWERFEQLLGEESEATVTRINAGHPMGGSVMWAAAAGGAGADSWRVYAMCSDPNYVPKGSNGSSPLQKALRYPDLKTAEVTAAVLLSNATNPNPDSKADSTPLHIAAERGSPELTEMLIRLGGSIDAKDASGKTPAQVAEKKGHQGVFDLLQNNEKIPRTCRTSRTAADVAGNRYEAPDFSDVPLYLRNNMVGKSHFNLEYVQTAVKADPRMAHSVATTSEICVEACAHIGKKEIVEFLLKHGAPYSLPTAVLLGDIQSITRMLDEDPNRIEERGAHDFGLLWYPAIGRCDLDLTHLLLQRGAQVEQQHFLGTTALHWACMRGPIELVELLVESGADVNRVGRKFKAAGETPLQSTKDEKIANYLRSKGATS